MPSESPRPKPRKPRHPKRDPWAVYEMEKAEIARTAPTVAEYDRRIDELARRLGL